MAVSAACRSPPRGSEGAGRTRARAGFVGPECQSSRLCARTVFSWSRQCRQPAPSAPWRRAPAPRAGGGRAAFRSGWGGGGSRRRTAHEQGPFACGALGDAALPCRARDAAGVRGRRCLPCGQRRCRVARRIFGVSRGKAGYQSVFPIRGVYRRAGERSRRALPRKRWRRMSPRKWNAPFSQQPLPHHPPAASAALYRHVSLPSLFRGEHPAHAPNTGFPRPQNPNVLSFPPPSPSPIPPAGRTAGSARARSRVQTLENPFWGNRRPFSRVSRPPKRRRRTAPARGPSAVYALCRRARNETKRPSPLLMGLGRVNTEPKALAAGTAGTVGTAGYMTCKSMHFRYLVSGAAGRMG